MTWCLHRLGFGFVELVIFTQHLIGKQQYTPLRENGQLSLEFTTAARLTAKGRKTHTRKSLQQQPTPGAQAGLKA